MGEVIPFRTRKELLVQRGLGYTIKMHQDLGSENHMCRVTGCNSQADACFEFVDVPTGVPMFKHYCTEHLNKGSKGVLK